MKYRFEIEAKNYEDFASGRVLYNRPGATAFPVRLGSEIIQRCLERVRERHGKGRLTLYDPCCGGAYLLTTIGFLHGQEFSKIYASDIDEAMLELAMDNLSLLTHAGMAQRIAQIQRDVQLYDKESHKEALASALRLQSMLDKITHLSFECRQIDVLRTPLGTVLEPNSIDVVITDVPYGGTVQWSEEIADPIVVMLGNLRSVLSEKAVVAVISDKKQKTDIHGYRKVERFKVGKRSMLILAPS